jgi:hypothetical protein
MERKAAVTISAASTLPDVALLVAAALSRHGIRAVLTGGACVSIYTNGAYVSRDADFVIQAAGPGLQQRIDAALATLGFARNNDRYVHKLTAFYVEFAPGPVSIGADLDIRPVERRVGGATALLLSPTDCCRDRLAAFYFWDDRQSLELAVDVAVHQNITLRRIRAWSVDEGSGEKYEEFVRELRSRKRSE